VVDREQPQTILGLLEQESIALACAIVTTRNALTAQATVPRVVKIEEPVETKLLN